MKPTKFISYCVSIIILAQLCLSFFALCKKASLAVDESLPVLEQRISLPYLYARGNNYFSVDETLSIEYNKEDPLVEDIDAAFVRKTSDKEFMSDWARFDKKDIYIILRKEDNKLFVDGYSTKKASEGFFLKASVSGARKNKNNGKITIQPDIENLKRFNFEGDKWDSIQKYLKELRSFNNALDKDLREKKITQKEYNQQSKKAYIYLRIDTSGNFFILDCIADGKSLTKDL